MSLLDDFMVRAVIAILALAMMTGPLGTIALWRRMGYFGDAAAHAALLGVAISLLLPISLWWSTVIIAIMVGAYLGGAEGKHQTSDGLLAVIAHGSLALALVIISISPQGRGNLEAYLFGDILAVSKFELGQLLLVSMVILVLVIWRWGRIIFTTLNAEMAAAYGINSKFEARFFTILLALAVAIGMQVIGALLIGALLIIPAMSARRFSNSPEKMALFASLITVVSGILGVGVSYIFDLPAAPALVVIASFIYIVSQLIKK